jgi:hypothetical protein
MSSKICSKCKLEKAISDYYFRKDFKKYNSRCKKCDYESSKEYLKLYKNDR